MSHTKILAIPGSLRSDSTNRNVLATASELAPPGVELETWDGLKELPPFDEDDEQNPPLSVLGMRKALGAAHAVLISTPEYNGSIPGQLKNALDWASRPPRAHALVDKPVAVIGASPTPFGAAWAQAELRKVLGLTGADILDQELPVPFIFDQFGPDGSLHDTTIRAALHHVLVELCSRAAPELEEVAV